MKKYPSNRFLIIYNKGVHTQVTYGSLGPYGGVEQLEARVAHNHEVGGSNPPSRNQEENPLY